MIFDPMYLVYALPGMLLAMIATWLTKSTFARYARVGASSGLTGAEAAQQMLASEGVNNVRIEMTQGFLSDHYDPRTNTLRLSPAVYQSQSLSAIGVACHEAGHALQKAHAYAPLAMRSALVPVTNFGSQLSIPILMAGFFLQIPVLVKVGIFLFIGVVVFSLITLPVEWDATARAKRLMVRAGIVSPAEQVHAGKVLNAAFLTYLASAVSAIMTLLYYLTLANRRND
jgi:hypothetical protein